VSNSVLQVGHDNSRNKKCLKNKRVGFCCFLFVLYSAKIVLAKGTIVDKNWNLFHEKPFSTEASKAKSKFSSVEYGCWNLLVASHEINVIHNRI
jgi:hypothetical protein